MNKDIRLSVSFFHHPKTVKLNALLGSEGIMSLLRLWCYAGQWKPKGDLSGMSIEEIETAALYNGPSGQFVAALLQIRFLDDNQHLHDWTEHNPWAFKSADRSDMARFSRMAKTHPNIFKELSDKGINAIDKSQYETLTKAQRFVNGTLNESKKPLTRVSSPDPDPDPVPSPKSKAKARGTFVPPSFDEVLKYCQERHNKVSAQQFVDFYQSKGWLIGKNSMKDWRAAVRTWERREDTSGLQASSGRGSGRSFVEQREERQRKRLAGGRDAGDNPIGKFHGQGTDDIRNGALEGTNHEIPQVETLKDL